MKTIISGSRSITDISLLKQAVTESQFTITEIVSGHANGVDKLGEVYAKYKLIPCKIFEPDWKTQGKKAGILRNIEMGNYAEQAIILWDGTSKGTAHMINYAKSKGLKVYVKIINQTQESV